MADLPPADRTSTTRSVSPLLAAALSSLAAPTLCYWVYFHLPSRIEMIKLPLFLLSWLTTGSGQIYAGRSWRGLLIGLLSPVVMMASIYPCGSIGLIFSMDIVPKLPFHHPGDWAFGPVVFMLFGPIFIGVVYGIVSGIDAYRIANTRAR